MCVCVCFNNVSFNVYFITMRIIKISIFFSVLSFVQNSVLVSVVSAVSDLLQYVKKILDSTNAYKAGINF